MVAAAQAAVDLRASPPERVQCWSGYGPAASSSGEALLLDPSERPPALAAYRVVPPLWACPGFRAAVSCGCVLRGYGETQHCGSRGETARWSTYAWAAPG